VSCDADDAGSLDSPGVCSAKVHSNNDSVRRDLDVVVRIAIAIDDRRRSGEVDLGSSHCERRACMMLIEEGGCRWQSVTNGGYPAVAEEEDKDR